MKNDCKKCVDLKQVYEIKSLLDLQKAMKVIRANLDDKTLIDRSQAYPFEELEDCFKNGSPWPEDILEYFFECSACKQKFVLVCETYHGSGGKWTPQDT